MRRVAALLAASLALAFLASCGGGGAEPGAPDGATRGDATAGAVGPTHDASLLLDFTPNAAHSGIYAAVDQGFYADSGISLHIQVPGASASVPRLLAAGKVDFAILDIHDLALAREQGLDLVGVQAIVHRPLGSVIVRADAGISSPRDLEGKIVGVTGLPSDDAILDSEVSADGGDPAAVDRVNIGFNAVADLAAGRVDAATAFWNVEGVALQREGVPVRIFKVDEFGAPSYPELILATTGRNVRENPRLVSDIGIATVYGNLFAADHPKEALTDLEEAVPALDRSELAGQMAVVAPALKAAFSRARPQGGGFNRNVLRRWAAWDVEHGILKTRPDLDAVFPPVPTAVQPR